MIFPIEWSRMFSQESQAGIKWVNYKDIIRVFISYTFLYTYIPYHIVLYITYAQICTHGNL